MAVAGGLILFATAILLLLSLIYRWVLLIRVSQRTFRNGERVATAEVSSGDTEAKPMLSLGGSAVSECFRL